MRKFQFNKLVRDKIVESILAEGNSPKFRILSEQDYLIELLEKLLEEASEIKKTNEKDLLGELADIQEIIDNLLITLNLTKKDLTKAQKQKNAKAGSFNKKIYIEYVEANEKSNYFQYYLDNPDKYPEIL